MSTQWAGPVLALTTFVTIAAGHVLVRRLHASFGTRPGITLFLVGIAGLAASLFIQPDLVSGVVGITAITVIWDGIEMYRQEKRVRRERRAHVE